MICPLCKGEIKDGVTTLTINLENDNIVTIYNIPAKICEQCGEEYFDYSTSLTLEKLKEGLKHLKLKMGFINYYDAA